MHVVTHVIYIYEIPVSVVQEESKSKKEQLELRGTMKDVVIQGDTYYPKLIVTSVYDAKPFCRSASCDGKDVIANVWSP